MAITTNNTADTYSGPYVGILNSLAINLRASHSFGVRIRWNTTATNVESYASWYVDNGTGTFGFAGSYIYRVNGAASGLVRFARANDSGTENSANATGAYGSTTEWVHLCFVYDAANTIIRSYVNGVANATVTSATTQTGSITNTDYMATGCCNAEAVDSFFFNRVLSADEVFAISRTRRIPGNMSGCLVWAPMHNPISLTEEGRDYSGTGRNLGLLASGTGNPAASNGNPPVRWNKNAQGVYVRQLTTPINFTGDGTSPSSMTGAFASQDTFVASSISLSSAAGALAVVKDFTAGSSASTSSCTGVFAVVKELGAGLGESPSSAAGVLGVVKDLGAGLATSPSSAAATLATEATFVGSSISPSSAAGALAVVKDFGTGLASSPSSAAGAIATEATFVGSSVSTSSCAGALAVYKDLGAGLAESPSECDAAFSAGTGEFIGLVVSTSACGGALAVVKDFTAGLCESTSSCESEDFYPAMPLGDGLCESPSSCEGAFGVELDLGAGLAESPSSCEGVFEAVVASDFSGDAISPSSCDGALEVQPTFDGLSVSGSACAGAFEVWRVFDTGASTSPSSAQGTFAARMVWTSQCRTQSSCFGTLSGGTPVNPFGPAQRGAGGRGRLPFRRRIRTPKHPGPPEAP